MQLKENKLTNYSQENFHKCKELELDLHAAVGTGNIETVRAVLQTGKYVHFK